MLTEDNLPIIPGSLEACLNVLKSTDMVKDFDPNMLKCGRLTGEELMKLHEALLMSNMYGRGCLVKNGKNSSKFGTAYRAKCSCNGSAVVVGCPSNRAVSAKCDCKFGYVLNNDGLKFSINKQNNSTHSHICPCKYNNEVAWTGSKEYTLLAVKAVKPQLIERQNATREAHIAASNAQLKTAAEVQLKELGVKLDKDHEQHVYNKILRDGMNAYHTDHGNTKRTESVAALLAALEMEKIEPLVQRSIDNTIESITFCDPATRLSDAQYHVLMVDVTHGITKGHFAKWSFTFGITASHDADLIAVTAIRHEDQATFEKELRYIKTHVDPTIDEREIVVLTDEDYGRINALRAVLPKAIVMLCWWHKFENIKKHFTKVYYVYRYVGVMRVCKLCFLSICAYR